MPIEHWSFSSLTSYERCPHTLTFPRRDKMGGSEQTKRGVDLHKAAEDWASSRGESPFPAKKIDVGWVFDEGNVLAIERAFWLDKQWRPSKAPNDRWLVAKPDLVVVPKDGPVTVVDYKSGKREGNEVKHQEQILLYMTAVAAFFEAESFVGALWYLDEERSVSVRPHSVAALERQKAAWNRRAGRMLDDDVLAPNPGKTKCSYCFYKEQCSYAYEV